MKQLLPFLLLIIALTSCEKNDVADAFDCNSSIHFSETKEMNDVLKKFKIDIPTDWNSKLYYDEYKSVLYSADTTKNLSETYIAEITWHQGELELNEDLDHKVQEAIETKEELQTIKSGFGKFKKFPAYYNLSNGKKMDFEYFYLQVYLQTKPDEYFTLTTKIYGNEFVDERICASVALFDNITFIQ
jgi:hypothetical protein